MIAKSKIKTFNNTRKYIKKNKIRGGGLLKGTDKNAAIHVQNLINSLFDGQIQEIGYGNKMRIIYENKSNYTWDNIFKNKNLVALLDLFGDSDLFKTAVFKKWMVG